MNRIEQALARAQGNPAVERHDQTPFTPPWPAEVSAPAAEPSTAPATPLLTPIAGDSLPRLNGRLDERLVTSEQCSQEMVEQYRRLAASLHTAQQTSNLRLILVTSAMPGDGKTLTAVNLALVLSESYQRRVLLVDADLRRPSIGEVFDVAGSVGLSTALRAPTDQKLAVLRHGPTLTLLPAGPPDPDPLAGLTSPRMRRILDDAVDQFDWVILDGPPTGPLAETSLLAQMVQGVVLVIRAGTTQYPDVQGAVDALGRDRILGVVLNGVAPKPANAYYQPYIRSNVPAARR